MKRTYISEWETYVAKAWLPLWTCTGSYISHMQEVVAALVESSTPEIRRDLHFHWSCGHLGIIVYTNFFIGHIIKIDIFRKQNVMYNLNCSLLLKNIQKWHKEYYVVQYLLIDCVRNSTCNQKCHQNMPNKKSDTITNSADWRGNSCDWHAQCYKWS